MNADWLPDGRTMRYIVDDVRPGLVVDDEQAASAVCLLAKPGMTHLRQRRVTAGNPPNQTLSSPDPVQWPYSCAAGVLDPAGGACAWGCAGAASGVAMEMP